jgi:excinuclease UvrABC ATPase subunit
MTAWSDSVVQAICDRYEIDPDTAWRDLTTEQQDLFLHGTKGDKLYVQYRNRMGRRRSYMTRFEGIVTNLERRYRETDSSQQRERIEEYMSFRPCPVCKGASQRRRESDPACFQSKFTHGVCAKCGEDARPVHLPSGYLGRYCEKCCPRCAGKPAAERK